MPEEYGGSSLGISEATVMVRRCFVHNYGGEKNGMGLMALVWGRCSCKQLQKAAPELWVHKPFTPMFTLVNAY